MAYGRRYRRRAQRKLYGRRFKKVPGGQQVVHNLPTDITIAGSCTLSKGVRAPFSEKVVRSLFAATKVYSHESVQVAPSINGVVGLGTKRILDPAMSGSGGTGSVKLAGIEDLHKFSKDALYDSNSPYYPAAAQNWGFCDDRTWLEYHEVIHTFQNRSNMSCELEIFIFKPKFHMANNVLAALNSAFGSNVGTTIYGGERAAGSYVSFAESSLDLYSPHVNFMASQMMRDQFSLLKYKKITLAPGESSKYYTKRGRSLLKENEYEMGTWAQATTPINAPNSSLPLSDLKAYAIPRLTYDMLIRVTGCLAIDSGDHTTVTRAAPNITWDMVQRDTVRPAKLASIPHQVCYTSNNSSNGYSRIYPSTVNATEKMSELPASKITSGSV